MRYLFGTTLILFLILAACKKDGKLRADMSVASSNVIRNPQKQVTVRDYRDTIIGTYEGWGMWQDYSGNGGYLFDNIYVSKYGDSNIYDKCR